MRARLPTRRVQAILSCLNHLRQGRLVSALTCQHLLGLLTAASLLIPLGLLHLQPLQRWFNSHRLHLKHHCHRQLRVTAQCLRALLRWRCRSFHSGGVEMLRKCRRELVSTDASQIGWEGMTKGRSANGCWLPPWSGRHINTLELRAVPLALQSFGPHLKGRHVMERTDNTSLVAYINHHRLHLIARELLLWAQGV